MEVFGGLYVTGGAASQTINMAEAKLTCWTSSMSSQETDPSPANDWIGVRVSGLYLISVSVSHDGTNSKTFHHSVHVQRVDGSVTEVPGTVVVRHQKVGEVTGGAASAVFQLEVGDKVMLWTSCLESDGVSLTVKEGSLLIHRN